MSSSHPGSYPEPDDTASNQTSGQPSIPSSDHGPTADDTAPESPAHVTEQQEAAYRGFDFFRSVCYRNTPLPIEEERRQFHGRGFTYLNGIGYDPEATRPSAHGPANPPVLDPEPSSESEPASPDAVPEPAGPICEAIENGETPIGEYTTSSLDVPIQAGSFSPETHAKFRAILDGTTTEDITPIIIETGDPNASQSMVRAIGQALDFFDNPSKYRDFND